MFFYYHRESPTVKQCFEAMRKTLQKRNIRMDSINYSTLDESSVSDSDNSVLNSTVIPNIQCETSVLDVQKDTSVLDGQNETLVDVQSGATVVNILESFFDTNDDSVDNMSSTFTFKVPEAPPRTTNTNNRRRSVRIMENLEKRKPDVPSHEPRRKTNKRKTERRQTSVSKKAKRESISGITKFDLYIS